jgi:hypothetical protein
LIRILILLLYIPCFLFPAGHNGESGSLQKKKLQSAGICITASWHYEPVAGKLVGIWPNIRYCTKEALKSYARKYGFSGISIRQDLFPPDSIYQWSLRAGFRPENMMVMVWDENYLERVAQMPAGYYYLDEPVEHNCSGYATNGTHIYPPAELTKRRDYVHSIRPNSKFVVGGYKRCSHLEIAANCADNIMYTSYVNWSSLWLPLCHVNMGFGDDMEAPWSQGSGLQKDSWGDMRSKFGAKFNMSWMHGVNDEYQELFQAANSLGLEGIWLYAYEGMGSDTAATLEKFCQAAAANGWLKIVDDYIPAPMNFYARKSQDGCFIRLQWTDVSDNEKGFIIERKPSSSETFERLAVVEPGCVSFIDSTVEEGNVYSYRMKAFNDYNSSDYSGESIISAPALPHLLFPEDRAKDQPLRLNFNWKPVADAESYSFMISENVSFTEAVILDSLLSKPGKEISGLKDGFRYYWKVSAKDPMGIKSYSEANSFITILPAPGDLKSEGMEGGKIRLTWADRSMNETGFYLERKSSDDSTYFPLANLRENSVTFTDSLTGSATFTYRLRAFNTVAYSEFSNEAMASMPTALKKKQVLPIDYTLFQNHPNPYNPSTKISYMLPSECRVRLLVYNSIGGVIKKLIDRVENAGFHELDFNAADLPSGIYFYSMEASALSGAGNFRATRKMLLLK